MRLGIGMVFLRGYVHICCDEIEKRKGESEQWERNVHVKASSLFHAAAGQRCGV